ncbi:MAG: SocA family protein [Alphaproteobacteria bacterium]|nr:SocA family protein [Alphaproteobacteria bacterium]
MYDARHLANFSLDFAGRTGFALSHMAVQKLVFFAHGWSLAHRGKPMVKNAFEAWKYGPVVRVLWDAFKQFGNKPVTTRALFVDPMTGLASYQAYAFGNEDVAFLETVLSYYVGFSAFTLSDLTHEAGMPWRTVREEMTRSANIGATIPDSEIRKSFESLSLAWLASRSTIVAPATLTQGNYLPMVLGPVPKT